MLQVDEVIGIETPSSQARLTSGRPRVDLRRSGVYLALTCRVPPMDLHRPQPATRAGDIPAGEVNYAPDLLKLRSGISRVHPRYTPSGNGRARPGEKIWHPPGRPGDRRRTGCRGHAINLTDMRLRDWPGRPAAVSPRPLEGTGPGLRTRRGTTVLITGTVTGTAERPRPATEESRASPSSRSRAPARSGQAQGHPPPPGGPGGARPGAEETGAIVAAEGRPSAMTSGMNLPLKRQSLIRGSAPEEPGGLPDGDSPGAAVRS
jgi:hypothetical protein